MCERSVAPCAREILTYCVSMLVRCARNIVMVLVIVALVIIVIITRTGTLINRVM